VNTFINSPDLHEKPFTGLCDPNRINEAIQKAGAIAPAFSFVPPPTRWDALLSFSPEQRDRAYSLVKAPKSPTKLQFDRKDKFLTDCAFNAGQHQRMLDTGEVPEPVTCNIPEGRENVGSGAPGVACIVEQRKWAEEVRVRSQVETAAGSPPPAQEGPRISEWLSDGGLTKLTDAAAYVAAIQGGFTTFVTLTFDDDARERLANGETSIQKEASRCFDAWGKMYKRGLVREGIEGHDDDFDYLWVVEVPDNEQGEPNPHLHVLMRWAVPFGKFDGWSIRLEKSWGQGFAHLEKIKNGKSAGAYIAKAIGYICKAQGKADQGKVRGNRYGISQSARAPGWELMSKMQLGCMSQLIADIYDHLSFIHGPDYAARKRLNKETAALKAEGASQRKKNNTKNSPNWIINKQKRTAAALEKVRARLDAVPVRANKYQIILKGEEATKIFFKWAYHPTGSASIYPADWLPEKPQGVYFDPGKSPGGNQALYFTKLREKMWASQRKRWAVSDEVCAQMAEQEQATRDSALSVYDDYDAFAGQQEGAAEASFDYIKQPASGEVCSLSH